MTAQPIFLYVLSQHKQEGVYHTWDICAGKDSHGQLMPPLKAIVAAHMGAKPAVLARKNHADGSPAHGYDHGRKGRIKIIMWIARRIAKLAQGGTLEQAYGCASRLTHLSLPHLSHMFALLTSLISLKRGLLFGNLLSFVLCGG